MAEDQNRTLQDKFMLRLPDGMRERLKEAAADSGRSMNAEIVVRLEQSLDGHFLDLSGAGFVAAVLRLEATVEAYDSFMFFIRDEMPGVDAVMVARGATREQTIRFIVSDWLREHGLDRQHPLMESEMERDQPEALAPRRGPEPSP